MDDTSLVTQDWTTEQVDLLKNTVARGASDNELKLFLYQCKTLKLDPFSKQIYWTPQGVVIGINGMLDKASRTGKLAGIQRGVKRTDKGEVYAAWARVRREGWEEPVEEEVLGKEFVKGTPNWSKMPETMLKKVALAHALRLAFPEVLSGIYAEEEMEGAQSTRVNQPTEEDGIITDPDLIIQYGPLKQRRWTDSGVSVEKLEKHLDSIDRRVQKGQLVLDDRISNYVELAEKRIEELKREH